MQPADSLTTKRATARDEAARPLLRGDQRRRSILTALHDCVLERGYGNTTLADVARAAGMSPSHLLYYFPGTNAILAHYFANVGQRIVERLNGIRAETPERQIHLLADLFFAGKGITKSEIGFMLECFGVAVHDKQLHREKTALDRACKDYLQQLFESSPCGTSNARSSAELAYAILVGLRTAAYFDQRLAPHKARRLFHAEMMHLANLTATVAGRKPRRS
ncbi:MAG: TetR/AcrR family transcriptional regulator [Steroidobacteraceae bacterium]